MSKVWARTKYMWKIDVIDVVNLTMRVKHVKTELAFTNCGENAQGGKWRRKNPPLQQVKVEKNLYFTEERQIVDASRPAVTGKTYAAMVNVSTTSVAIQTNLTWTNGEVKYKKIANIEKILRKNMFKIFTGVFGFQKSTKRFIWGARPK